MIRGGPRTLAWMGYCLLAASLGAASPPALAQSGEAVVVRRPAELREAPGDAARSLAPLAVQAPVTRLGERQGPWIKVRNAQGQEGWVHLFDVGAAGTPPSGGNAATGALRSLTNFFNKGSAQAGSSTLPTSTVGIRGLGAEDLAHAQPNPGAVSQAEAWRLDAGQARQFASNAALASQAVPALPAPPRPQPAAPRGAPGGSQEQMP
jgi:hypothetical protein